MLLLTAFLALRPNPIDVSRIPLTHKPPVSSIPSVFGPMPNIYRDGWIDLNKNGRKDVYEDRSAPLDRRIENLLKQMSVEEKTCQLATLYGFKAVLQDQLPTLKWKDEIWKDGIGNIDEHLDAKFGRKDESPYWWPPSNHAAALNEVQRFFIEQTRLGIPADFTVEGIQGVASFAGTSLPIPLGMGATWNPGLIRKGAEITGHEARMLGYTNVYAPILDVLRDQRWGRAEETYGEDPWLVSKYGIEIVKGLQGSGVASTAKHFAVYNYNKGAREGYSRTDPHVSPRAVHEIALAPFKAAVMEADMLGVMASYNDYDGVPVIASPYFQIDLLRKSWGFRGYVVSDSDAVEYVHSKHKVAENYQDAVRMVIEGGMNVRTTFTPPKDFILPLRKNIAERKLTMKVLDERVRDVLRVKFFLGLFDRPYRDDLPGADREVSNSDSNSVALQMARESLVLLKNSNKTLPWKREQMKVAVIGPLADNTDWVCKRYGPFYPETKSVLAGLRDFAPSVEWTHSRGCGVLDSNFPASELYPHPLNDSERIEFNEAIDVASKADRILLVVGDTNATSGESRTRTSLDLPGRQGELVRAMLALNKPVVAIVLGGRPMSINELQAKADAILYAFLPGAHGHRAIAEAIFGDYNPGGKLSCTFPKSVGQIPFNFPAKPASQNEGLQRPIAVPGALYPFGFGLSYTKFDYSDLRISTKELSSGQSIAVNFRLTNTGQLGGDEICQLYVRQAVSSVTTYEKLLRGFKRVHLKPGESKVVELTVPWNDLQILDKNMKWTVERSAFAVMVGASSEDIRLKGEFVTKP